MENINVTLLGNFQITIDNQPLDIIDSAKMQSLLVYLFFHPFIPLSRRQIAYRLWPDSSESQAMANLRHLLFSLRRAYPRLDQILEIQSHSIQLHSNLNYQLDVQEFEKSASQLNSRPELQKAVRIYCGDLLPGFYDDWIQEQRNRLHSLYVQTLERLVQLFEQARDYPNAVHWAQRMIENEPFEEKNYRHAMTLYALNNDRAAAISVYHRCVEFLRQELDVEPARETIEVYELLLSSEAVPSSMTLTSPLVGRKEEWRQMQNAWSEVLHRHSQMILLVGEAGIGKTRLAEEMAHWISKQGIPYAPAHCYPFEGSIAYAPLTEWLSRRPLNLAKDPWLVEISRLLPEIQMQRPDLPAPQPLQESWQRQAFFEALGNVIAGDRRPLLLWIDDLHWCDRDTIEWLYFFLRTRPEERVLILGTARAEEVENNQPLTQLISALNSSSQITQILLPSFDLPDTAALGAFISGSPLEPQQAKNLFQESEGNPLFIVELMRAQFERVQEGAGFPDNFRNLPQKIHQVIGDRLRMMSPSAYQLAGLAAVLGRSFSYPILHGASGIGEGILVDLLDELWRKGIIREQGAQNYVFGHEKIRETIYSNLSLARKRLLHRQVAETIERLEQNSLDFASAQLAYHYEQAGVIQRAVEFYLQAANQASHLLSNAEAISSLQRGLKLLETMPPSHERNQRELGYQLALGAAYLTRQIRAPEVRQSYARAYDLAKSVGTDAEQFMALKGLWEYDNYWLSLTQAFQYGKTMLHTADQAGRVDFRVAALYSLGTTAFLQGELVESRKYLEDGLALIDVNSLMGEIFHGVHPAVGCRSRLAWTLCFLGYPDRAFTMGDDAVRIAQNIGHPFSQCSALTLQTFLLLMFGKNQEAGLLADQAIALSEQYDYRFWSSSARRMRGWATVQPDQEKAWNAVLQRENQEWLNIHILKPPIWFSLSQSLYINGLAVSGRVPEGLERLEAVLEKLEGSPEMIWKPELYRLKGSLLLLNGSPQSDVECWYQQAAQLACAQHSRLLELKAVTSLARLELSANSEDRLTESVGRLRNLLDSFSAQADLPDFQDARGLLARLA